MINKLLNCFRYQGERAGINGIRVYSARHQYKQGEGGLQEEIPVQDGWGRLQRGNTIGWNFCGDEYIIAGGRCGTALEDTSLDGGGRLHWERQK